MYIYWYTRGSSLTPFDWPSPTQKTSIVRSKRSLGAPEKTGQVSVKQKNCWGHIVRSLDVVTTIFKRYEPWYVCTGTYLAEAWKRSGSGDGGRLQLLGKCCLGYIDGHRRILSSRKSMKNDCPSRASPNLREHTQGRNGGYQKSISRRSFHIDASRRYLSIKTHIDEIFPNRRISTRSFHI